MATKIISNDNREESIKWARTELSTVNTSDLFQINPIQAEIILSKRTLNQLVVSIDKIYCEVIRRLTLKRITYRNKIRNKDDAISAIRDCYSEVLETESENYLRFRESPTALAILGAFGNKKYDPKFIQQCKNKKYKTAMRAYAEKTIKHVLDVHSRINILERYFMQKYKLEF